MKANPVSDWTTSLILRFNRVAMKPRTLKTATPPKKNKGGSKKCTFMIYWGLEEEEEKL